MLEIAKIKAEEGAMATNLIISLFEQYIFADYTEAGKLAVRGYVTASSLVADDSENFAMVARLQGSLVGVAKVKRKTHLSMLFVSADCQGRRYGRRLVETAITECKARNPDVTCMIANSSRFALPFFLSRGFRAMANEEQVNGVRFTRVRLDFAHGNQGAERTTSSAHGAS